MKSRECNQDFSSLLITRIIPGRLWEGSCDEWHLLWDAEYRSTPGWREGKVPLWKIRDLGQCWLQVLDRVRHHWVSSVFRAHSEPTDFPPLEKPAETLETAALHSTLLTALPAVFQRVVVLINSIHARTFPGEKGHTQHFPGAAASHLDVESLWFHLQKLLGFIITLLCAGCVVKNWLLRWTQPMAGLRNGQFRYKTSRKSSCGAWSSLCQLFLAQAVQQGWHSLLSTGKEHFQQQHWAGQWWTLCEHRDHCWRPSLNQGLSDPIQHQAPVSKDTEGGHLLLAGYLIWLCGVVSPLHHLLSHKDCCQIVQNCKLP